MTTGSSGASPVISGTQDDQTTTSEAPVTPFAKVDISDPNAGATDTLTIALSGGGGVLTDGAGFDGLVANSDGSYTLTGNAAALTSELQALVFTPAAGAPGTQTTTTFTLSDSTNAVSSAFNATPITLANFDGADGSGPVNNLIADAAGDLFGTAYNGGAYSDGTVFEVVRTGSGYSAPITLASFDSADGAGPEAGLAADSAGDLFGTTLLGGTANDGTVFELVKTATGYSAPVTLASFDGQNGSTSYASLYVDAAGDLFGTTLLGGSNDAGTLFELVKTSSGYAPLATLVNFDGTDGDRPQGGLIADAAGDLFGMADLGGPNGGGTVYELVKTASGFGAVVTLAAFDRANGYAAWGNLTADAAGDLFGTTEVGGASDQGTVFELVNNGTGYSAPVTLANFSGTDGAEPIGSLIVDAAGDVFGTTNGGGINNDGTVFELVNTPNGYSAPLTLYLFDSTNGNGAYPDAGLMFDSAGNLIGTTGAGGASGDGTVFELTRAQIAAATATASVVDHDPPIFHASTGGVVINFVTGLDNAAYLSGTNGHWDTVNGSAGTIYVTGAQASITGGADTIALDGSTVDSISLYQTAGDWDTVTGSLGTVIETGAQASVTGGNDTLWLNGGSSASLYGTDGNWDAVNGANSFITLNAGAQAAVAGGSNTIWLSGTGNAASINATAGNWDTVNGSSGTVILTAAQASIAGGNDTLWLNSGSSVSLYGTDGDWDTANGTNASITLNQGAQATVQGSNNTVWLSGSGDATSLYATAGDWDTVNGSSGTVTLTAAQTSVIGGNDTLWLNGGSSVSLYATNGNWDTLDGSGATVIANSAQASIFGGNDTVWLNGGSSVSLFDTAGAADTVAGNSGTLILNGVVSTLKGNGDIIWVVGSNALTLSGNNETIRTQQSLGNDTVTGFNSTDHIQFSASDFSSYAALLNATRQSGSDTIITLDTNDQITLKGVTATSLSASQFSFV